MSEHAIKVDRRRLRKLLGSDGTRMVVETSYDFRMFLRRGFFGRVKWLLFGR